VVRLLRRGHNVLRAELVRDGTKGFLLRVSPGTCRAEARKQNKLAGWQGSTRSAWHCRKERASNKQSSNGNSAPRSDNPRDSTYYPPTHCLTCTRSLYFNSILISSLPPRAIFLQGSHPPISRRRSESRRRKRDPAAHKTLMRLVRLIGAGM
jgi:hypothetical protein